MRGASRCHSGGRLSGKTVRDVAKSKNVMAEKELTEALDPMSMTRPG